MRRLEQNQRCIFNSNAAMQWLDIRAADDRCHCSNRHQCDRCESSISSNPSTQVKPLNEIRV